MARAAGELGPGLDGARYTGPQWFGHCIGTEALAWMLIEDAQTCQSTDEAIRGAWVSPRLRSDQLGAAWFGPDEVSKAKCGTDGNGLGDAQPVEHCEEPRSGR